MKKHIAAVLAVLGLAGVMALGSVAPAQAFPTVTYLADCPGNARYQQLVIRNYSGDSIRVQGQPNPPFGQIYWVADSSQKAWGGGLIYATIMHHDKAQYWMYGNGSLNWFYHVDCFY